MSSLGTTARTTEAPVVRTVVPEEHRRAGDNNMESRTTAIPGGSVRKVKKKNFQVLVAPVVLGEHRADHRSFGGPRDGPRGTPELRWSAGTTAGPGTTTQTTAIPGGSVRKVKKKLSSVVSSSGPPETPCGPPQLWWSTRWSSGNTVRTTGPTGTIG